MGALREVWSDLKRWRAIRLGPVSVVFRFRRTVRVSTNRRAEAVLRSVPNLAGTRLLGSGDRFPASKTDSNSVTVGATTEVAVLFGVGPGFGFALARKLVESGLAVALVSRRAENLRSLMAELTESHPGRASLYSCDVTDDHGVREVLGLVERDFGVPHLVVYSTQNSVPGNAIDIETDAFEDCWRVNCLGGFIVAREAARAMRPARRGSIILIGSTSGLIGREGHLSMAVGKFGLRAVAQVMARELWQDALHVAHVVIDADIRERGGEQSGSQSDPRDIAELVHSIHKQPRTAWTSEVDVRPWNEKFWQHC